MRFLLLSGTAFTLAILAACGSNDGGEGKILHLQAQDITETAYRDYARSVLLGVDGTLVCRGIQDLSASEIVRMFDLASTPNPTMTPFPGGVPVARETGAPEDRERAAKIIQEECQRMAP